MENKNYLKVKDLNITLGKEIILNNINFEVQKGEFVSIIGPSGSGKTTLLNAIAQLIPKTSGQILIDNKSEHLNIGYVFQDFNLYDNISVYNNIFLSIKNSNEWYFQKIIEYLSKNISDSKLNDIEINKKLSQIDNNIFDSLDDLKSQKKIKRKIASLKFQFFFALLKNKKSRQLVKPIKFLFNSKKSRMAKSDIIQIAKDLEIENLLNKKPSQISGGQKQRASIAKAIAKKASIILLDEPFAAFDAKLKERARDWLKETQKKLKITMLFVTHDQNDAMLISDKIIFINKKTIAQFSTPKVLFDNPVNLEIAKFVGYPEIIFLKKEKGKSLYIRSNNISLKKSNKATNIVKNIVTNGNYDILVIYSPEYQRELQIIANVNEYSLNEKAELIINKEKILYFNDEGERIYE